MSNPTSEIDPGLRFALTLTGGLLVGMGTQSRSATRLGLIASGGALITAGLLNRSPLEMVANAVEVVRGSLSKPHGVHFSAGDSRHRPDQRATHASEESFPASDPPSPGHFT